MKMKKLTALFLTAVMAASTLTMAAQAEEKVELTFMGWEASPLETKAVEDGIAAFEAQYPNITVNYTPGLAGAEYNAKLLSSAAAGAMPDVMFVAASSYTEFATKGVLLELTDKFDENYKLDDFIDSSKEIMDINGKVYGISSCTVSPIIFYNKDVFDAAGVPYPSSDPATAWTIDEFREVAKQLTTDDIYGVYGLEVVANVLNAQILSNGGAVYNEDYTESALNSPEVKEVLETIKAIRVEDGSAPDSATLEAVGMSASQMLQTGKVAMLCDGSWALQELAASGMNIGIAPMPSYGEVLTTGQAHLHAIAADTEHPEEAWQFLQFLSGMDYQGALVATGLWMPNRHSLYEEEAVAQWCKEEVYGTDFAPLMDYFKNAKVDPSALQYATQAGDIVVEETDMFFKMDQDIDVTLQNIVSRVNEATAIAMGN